MSGASRNGTRRAITPEHYQQLWRKPALRMRGWLRRWRSRDDGVTLAGSGTEFTVAENVAEAIERGENRLKVVFGTKGGRPAIRQFWILAQSGRLWKRPYGRGSTQWQADRQA